MVDSHLIPVDLTMVGLSLALHNKVVMGLVEMIIIETLEMVNIEMMVKMMMMIVGIR